MIVHIEGDDIVKILKAAYPDADEFVVDVVESLAAWEKRTGKTIAKDEVMSESIDLIKTQFKISESRIHFI